MSGAVLAISSKVLKVFSGLASGSPGPAMPSTVICGMVDATASTFLAACSGVSFSLTTPGAIRWRNHICDCSNCTGCCRPAPPPHACAHNDDALPRCSRDGSSPSPRSRSADRPGRRRAAARLAAAARRAAALVLGDLLHDPVHPRSGADRLKAFNRLYFLNVHRLISPPRSFERSP